eukprot:sb/3469050/
MLLSRIFFKLSPPWLAHKFLFAPWKLVFALTPLFLEQFRQTKVLRTHKIMLFPMIYQTECEATPTLASAPGPKRGCGGTAPTFEIPYNSKNKRESTCNTSTHKHVKTCQCYYIQLLSTKSGSNKVNFLYWGNKILSLNRGATKSGAPKSGSDCTTLDVELSIYGGSSPGQKLILGRFHGHISTQNGRYSTSKPARAKCHIFAICAPIGCASSNYGVLITHPSAVPICTCSINLPAPNDGC